METKDTMDRFCKNVVHLRKKFGYTQREMADILAIRVSSLRKLERGIIPRCVTAKTLYNLCSHFQFSADLLLNDIL